MKHLTQGLTALVWQRFKPNSDSDPTLLTPSFYNTSPPRSRACWPREPEDRSAENTAVVSSCPLACPDTRNVFRVPGGRVGAIGKISLPYSVREPVCEVCFYSIFYIKYRNLNDIA